MAQNVTLYNLLISCPGDIKEEVTLIESAVDEFNELYAETLGITIKTRHWSKSSYAQSGGKPQALLNEQFVNKCDAAVAIFWTRFGSPTDEYGSGTEEEIEIMLQSGKQVFMYFSDKPIPPSKINGDGYEKIQALDYFGKGKSLEALKSNLWVYRNEIYENGDPDSIFYVDILVAVIIVACENSSWSLLPSSSGILDEEWESYLQSKMSIKMLWPAQRLIAEKGLLRGESSIVQLPTGVGKTRSIELIIRAAFLSERANIAIIVAPLRALCNEITMDMYKAFGNDVTINQFSDVLQNDFWNLFSEDIKRQILICTPEKLSYVLHHDPFFLSAIDLFVFDEGHMFDDGGRGATYELLVTHIRQNITSEQQLVLLSAVLPNSGDIAQWLFEDRGCLATDDSIVSTPKSIGFSSTQRDIHFFSDDKSNEDYYIPRILRVEQLKKLPRERSNKYFPDLSLSTDVAIYNAIKLCHNGGVAIYLGQQRSMKTVFERIINLDSKRLNLG